MRIGRPRNCLFRPNYPGGRHICVVNTDTDQFSVTSL